ncbi:hypothetical protein SNE40_003552 [Patella caerulea]|uniref:Peptidase S1 domain-containing protein n=1 Tax=Patella caerulea TaxID=87958 RepID=A0AAN8KIE7_PATCE
MKVCLLLALFGCVFSAPSERIVGGSNAYAGQFPWQVSLQVSSGSSWSHNCGGILISSNRVLTAAHCVDGRSASQFRVVLGEHRLQNTDGTEQYLSLSSLVMHPSYDGNNNNDGFAHDFAVLRLSGSANTGSSAVSIIGMANSGDDFTNEKCTISGWGRTVGGGSLPNTLQYIAMTQISNAQCRSAMSSVGGASIGSGHICVAEPNKSACNGDSGGPMVCSGKLAGVTSWVVGSCLTSYPSVYGRVSEYRNWIDSI